MTVSFSGLSDRTHGPYCALTFSSNFGSGAAGVATSPGGCDGNADFNCLAPLTPPSSGNKCGPPASGPRYDPSDRGPLTGVLLTNPGSCYAKLGRVAPELTATGGGADATFTVNTTQHEDSEGFHYWKVSSISVSGGEEYYDQSELTISHSVGDTKVTQATAKVNANADGVPLSVTVTEPGKYYRESKDAEPYVAEVTVTLCSGAGGNPPPEQECEIPQCPESYSEEECGEWQWAVIEDRKRAYEELVQSYHAEIEAVVNADPHDENFGQIESLDITSGGKGYLVWRWRKVCHHRLNGNPLVLRAKTPTELISLHPIEACYGKGACGRVVPFGSREAPEVCAHGSGSGGSITVTLSGPQFETEDDEPWKPYWKIASVSASGGENYPDAGSATVTYIPSGTTVQVPPQITLTAASGSLTGATVEEPGKFYYEKPYDGSPGPIKIVEVINKGSGYAKKGRVQPTLTASATGAGSGATFTPSLAQEQDDCGVHYWYVQSVSVSGGEGYESGSPLTFALSGSGVKDEDATAEVVISSDPESNGVPVGVTVSNGGKYYRESNSASPYVAEVTVNVTQVPPSSGSGAEFEAEVEADPTKPGFGTIKKIKVTEGGSGYSLWGGPKDCEYEGACGIRLKFLGTNKEPEVYYDGAVFRATEALVDCNQVPSTASVLHSIGGGSVTIERGGAWDPSAECPCSPSGGTDGGNCTPTDPPADCAQAGESTQPTPCPPCRGPCNKCNPCPVGCSCTSGSCEPCDRECDSDNPCSQDCKCVNGRCVPELGCCCTSTGGPTYWGFDGLVPGVTRSQCENCSSVSECVEYAPPVNGPCPPGECPCPPIECPPGFDPDPFGFGCSRSTLVESCDGCNGACYPYNTGMCGTFYPDCDAGRKYVLLVNCTAGVSFECGGAYMIGPDGKCHVPPWGDNQCWNDPVTVVGGWDTAEECQAEYDRIMAIEAPGPDDPCAGCDWPPIHGSRCFSSCSNSSNSGEGNPLP